MKLPAVHALRARHLQATATSPEMRFCTHRSRNERKGILMRRAEGVKGLFLLPRIARIYTNSSAEDLRGPAEARFPPRTAVCLHMDKNRGMGQLDEIMLAQGVSNRRHLGHKERFKGDVLDSPCRNQQKLVRLACQEERVEEVGVLGNEHSTFSL